MSFYPLFQQTHAISPAVRGLARLIEGGTWINWCGDGAWRNLTPRIEEWTETKEGPFAGVRGLSQGRTLRFSRYDRDVSWPKEMYGECYPLSAEEKEYLYAIYERVYLLPEQAAVRAAKAAETQLREKAAREWMARLEANGTEATLL